MGKTKKYIIAMILFMATVLCLNAQNNTINENKNIENSIVLSDNTNTDTTFQSDIKKTSTVGTFVRMIVVLIIVIGLIYGVLWFIKKKTNVVKTEDDYLRRAAYINIAPGKSIEVITLIDKAYLIGVTEDNITLLGEIDDKELVQAMNINADKKANTKKPANFSEVLDMFLIKGNKNKNIFSDTEQKVEELFEKNKKE